MIVFTTIVGKGLLGVSNRFPDLSHCSREAATESSLGRKPQDSKPTHKSPAGATEQFFCTVATSSFFCPGGASVRGWYFPGAHAPGYFLSPLRGCGVFVTLSDAKYSSPVTRHPLRCSIPGGGHDGHFVQAHRHQVIRSLGAARHNRQQAWRRRDHRIGNSCVVFA